MGWSCSLVVEECLRLCQFIVMVGELQVLSASVNVHLGTNDLAGHCTAFNVPAYIDTYMGTCMGT